MAGPVHEVVVVGGGFGGLAAAQTLARQPVRVTLIDRRNHHLFQPLLYQVATGALSPANIAAPLRTLVRSQTNCRVILAEVEDFDVAARAVIFSDGGRVGYDSLILATGSGNSYFGHDEWAEFAPGLKTVEDATDIRHRVLAAFEKAERVGTPDEVKDILTFVIAGAGPTGVEMAGAIAELAHKTFQGDFHRIDPRSARVLLVDAEERVLPPFQPDLSERAMVSLKKMGVEVWTKAKVTNVRDGSVTIKRGEDDEQDVKCSLVFWAAGVHASPLGAKLAKQVGVEVDKGGRVPVQPDLTIPGHPELYVIGDVAAIPGQARTSLPPKPGHKPTLPGLSPVAMQGGAYAAHSIVSRIQGDTVTPFVYWDKGTMATIGRASAVADLGFVRFGGLLAWLAWLFIHLLFLVQFESRILVLFQWAWNYVTRNRSARLITGPELGPPKTAAGARPATV